MSLPIQFIHNQLVLLKSQISLLESMIQTHLPLPSTRPIPSPEVTSEMWKQIITNPLTPNYQQPIPTVTVPPPPQPPSPADSDVPLSSLSPKPMIKKIVDAVDNASFQLRESRVKLSKHGYHLSDKDASRRQEALKKAIEEYTYPEVMIKLNALYVVWKESKAFFKEYVNHLSQDIYVLDNSLYKKTMESFHLSTYGYSLTHNDERRKQALIQAVQGTSKEKVLIRIKQLLCIWSSRSGSMSQTYMNNLVTDYKILSSM